jgi:tetraacyldisaccharide 4'-kinase
MERRALIDILAGRRNGAGPAALRGVLRAASEPYAAAMRVRRWAYGRGVLPSREASVPVISVGNLTAGGTGKTPMVAWVVRHLLEAGRSPAILTRGYKQIAGRSDEAELLKRLCRAPVIVNPDRVTGAHQAIARDADVLVMDDGFQHRRLRRQLDIVLIDALCPLGFERCLPRGLLREPPSALADADAIVITRSNAIDASRRQALADRLGDLAPQASLHEAIHEPVGLVDESGRCRPLDDLAGRRVLAFCGLGNPEAFFHSLRDVGAELTGRRAFDDHTPYTPAMLTGLVTEAGRSKAELLVTTQKDAVKFSPRGLGLPVWQLAIEMKVVAGEEALIDRVQSTAARSV